MKKKIPTSGNYKPTKLHMHRRFIAAKRGYETCCGLFLEARAPRQLQATHIAKEVSCESCIKSSLYKERVAKMVAERMLGGKTR